MSVVVLKDDIENAQCDVIVNASNGVGYMGGKRSIKKRCSGVDMVCIGNGYFDLVYV